MNTKALHATTCRCLDSIASGLQVSSTETSRPYALNAQKRGEVFSKPVFFATKSVSHLGFTRPEFVISAIYETLNPNHCYTRRIPGMAYFAAISFPVSTTAHEMGEIRSGVNPLEHFAQPQRSDLMSQIGISSCRVLIARDEGGWKFRQFVQKCDKVSRRKSLICGENMSVAQIYTKGFHKQTRCYFAHWLPTYKLNLGSVGILEDGCIFKEIGQLHDFGIQFDPLKDIIEDDSPSSLEMTSTEGVELYLKQSGQLNASLPSIPQANAGVGIAFGKEGAFVLRASQIFEPRIGNIPKLEESIIKACENGVWKSNYCILSRLVTAPYLDLIISESKNSKLELQADASFSGEGLGESKNQFSVVSRSGAIVTMLGCKNVTPAFQLMGLKRRFFKKGQLRPMQVGALGALTDEELGGDLRDGNLLLDTLVCQD